MLFNHINYSVQFDHVSISIRMVHVDLVFILVIQMMMYPIFNPMRTTCRLLKMNILSYIEPIRRGVRKNSLMCKFVNATFLKPYHDWLYK